MITQQPLAGKILFKRTDIVTMKKDIKMLRELDLRKEQLKSLEPIAPKAPAEAQKQRVFALKAEEALAQAKLKELEAQKEAVFAKEKSQLVAKQQEQAEVLKSIHEKEGVAKWAVERKAVETKKQMDELEIKNKEAENQKRQLQQKIAQTNDALSQAKPVIEEKIEPQKPAPAVINENDRRKKFMEDIEAWANSSKN